MTVEASGADASAALAAIEALFESGFGSLEAAGH
jgi:phosphotransferase system HPr-like phosphotransfer protein